MNDFSKVLLKYLNQKRLKTIVYTQAGTTHELCLCSFLKNSLAANMSEANPVERGLSLGTNLQLRFSGPEVLGCGSSHCDDSNQLRIFRLQPLLEVPQELGEIVMAAFCFLGQNCLQESTT